MLFRTKELVGYDGREAAYVVETGSQSVFLPKSAEQSAA
jgi:hypothetical protein